MKHKVLFYYHTNVEVEVEMPDDATEDEIIKAARRKTKDSNYYYQVIKGLVEDADPDIND